MTSTPPPRGPEDWAHAGKYNTPVYGMHNSKPQSGGKPGDIEQGAAANGQHVRMAVNMKSLDLRMNFRDVKVGVLGAFATLDDQGRADEFEVFRGGGEIRFDLGTLTCHASSLSVTTSRPGLP